jgi:hypothetical protein
VISQQHLAGATDAQLPLPAPRHPSHAVLAGYLFRVFGTLISGYGLGTQPQDRRAVAMTR